MERSKASTRRCAIYTRKSSEEGLEQDFNSLHAQREACEAFIKSQAGEGWRPVKAKYDDGGFSGATMDRPALKTLLAHVKEKRIDVVVVYKVDRLTRSLTDFAKRRREGRVQHRDRLSDRSRSAVAVAEERAAWTPPSRPACRGLGQRDRADAGGGTRHPCGRHLRGDLPSHSWAHPRRAADLGASHRQMAGAQRSQPRCDLPPRSPAGANGPVRLHRHGRAQRHDRR